MKKIIILLYFFVLCSTNVVANETEKKLNKLSPEERSQLGIFLAFQYPVEIPGVSNEEFLRIAYNLKRKSKNLPDLNPIEFLEILKVSLSKAFFQNVNFFVDSIHILECYYEKFR